VKRCLASHKRISRQNLGDWQPVQVVLSARARWLLRRMVDGGLWGFNIEQCAQWIILEKLREELREKRL
jgi:hypothetical protein